MKKIDLGPINKASTQLMNAIKDAQSELEITGTIKCFEYCYELSWKTMKRILENQGITDINSPRAVFAAAFKTGLIDNLDMWNSFIEKINLTSHTYDEMLAHQVFHSLPIFTTHLNSFIKKVENM